MPCEPLLAVGDSYAKFASTNLWGLQERKARVLVVGALDFSITQDRFNLRLENLQGVCFLGLISSALGGSEWKGPDAST